MTVSLNFWCRMLLHHAYFCQWTLSSKGFPQKPLLVHDACQLSKLSASNFDRCSLAMSAFGALLGQRALRTNHNSEVADASQTDTEMGV